MRLDAKLGLFALGVAVRRAMCGAIDGVISVVLGMVASEHVFDFVCDVRHIVWVWGLDNEWVVVRRAFIYVLVGGSAFYLIEHGLRQ